MQRIFRSRRISQSWRLRAVTSSEEKRRVERWLATSRVFLAISALFAMWIRAADDSRNSLYAYVLVIAYLAFSVAVMLLFRYWKEPSSWAPLLVHGVDTLWPAVISIFSTSRTNPFFLFFFFALLAAAYRWGLWETLATSLIAVTFPVAEAFLLKRLNLVHALPPDLDASRLFERAISLLVMALLLGYLAEQQKQLRAEKTIVAGMLGKARVEAGLNATLRDVLLDVLRLYGAKAIRICSLESNSLRLFLGEVTADGSLKWLDASVADREKYLFPAPSPVWLARLNGVAWTVRGLDPDGHFQRELPPEFLSSLSPDLAMRSVAGVDFVLGQEWSGRIFLVQPDGIWGNEEELRFLQEVIRQVGPAVYNVFLLRRLRQRAGAVERTRVARELHDGAVQSLIAMEMQVDILRRQAEQKADTFAGELARIQQLLREEVLKLRELMQQMKSIDVDGRRLPAFLADTAERFQRETGIHARFISEVAEVPAVPRICRELARITQEALVNVRKHSKANQVLIRLGMINGDCRLIVEDDGQGFDFAGTMSQDEMEALRKGPVVIRERVRFIEGKLTIESKPGKGARLEVTLPSNPQASSYA